MRILASSAMRRVIVINSQLASVFCIGYRVSSVLVCDLERMHVNQFTEGKKNKRMEGGRGGERVKKPQELE